jgi:hypothetical protein
MTGAGASALIATCLCSAGCAEAFPLPATPEPPLPYQRTAVVGASLSAGFCSRPLAVKMRAIAPEGAEVLDATDMFLFSSPYSLGAAQIDRTVAFRPTLVLALDYLFWFAYYGRDLSVGLRELERIDVPLVVGDVPWMGRAAEWMLSPSGVPSRTELRELNIRIRIWASERPNVTVVPVARWVDELYAGAPSKVPWRVGLAAGALLCPDGLHPNDDGADFVLARALDQAEGAAKGGRMRQSGVH